MLVSKFIDEIESGSVRVQALLEAEAIAVKAVFTTLVTSFFISNQDPLL